MRGKIAKALRRMAARQVQAPETEYNTVHVKDVKYRHLDNTTVTIPHYRTTVTRTSRRAFYQWLKKEFAGGRLSVVA